MTAPTDSDCAACTEALDRHHPPAPVRRGVLMVAFHYPPDNTPGALRTLKFTKYLGAHGWDASVLTVPASRHEAADAALLGQIPHAVRVHRAPCFDAKAAFAIRGRYPAFVEIPDRYWSWLPLALRHARRIVRREGVRAVFSTSPIPTAHLVACAIKTLARVPWVADIRDPLGPRPVGRCLERMVIGRADHVVTTTQEAADQLCAVYGEAVRPKICAIYNGYDEDDFTGLAPPGRSEPVFRLTHAGYLYPTFRHPATLLQALRACIDAETLPRELQLYFPGAGELGKDAALARQLADLRLGHVVRFSARVPHHEALSAMCSSSALVLLQGGRHTRTQVPSKAFEYLRSGRPLLVLAAPDSATAKVLVGFPAVYRADPDDVRSIAAALNAVYQQWVRGARLIDRSGADLDRYERRRTAAALAQVLNTLVPESTRRARGCETCH